MNSLAALFSVAVQSAKGVAATTGFHSLRAERSRALVDFTYDDVSNEHGGSHQRASTLQSTPQRISQSIGVSFEGRLYPNAIGAFLVGMGFLDTVTNNTSYRTHAFIKSNVDAARWLSLLHAVGEGAGRFERKVTDVRLTNLTITANRQGIRLAGSGIGLNEGLSAGTETKSAEASVRLLPTLGSLAYGGLGLGLPREHVITINRPVEEDDQRLHTFGLAGLEEMGFEVNGTLRGLDLSEATYRKIVYGASNGTSPSAITLTDSLSFNFPTSSDMPGSSGNPYNLAFDIAKAEFRMTNFEAAGNSIIRCDVDYRMIDDTSSAPITISLDNQVTSYY